MQLVEPNPCLTAYLEALVEDGHGSLYHLQALRTYTS